MRRTRWLLAAAALAATTLAGCSNELDAGAGAVQTSAPSGQLKPKGDLTIAVVTHGSAGDAFWTVVKNGAEQAGKDLGVTVKYQSSGDPATQSQYIDAAVNQKVDGLIVSMANPDALETSVRAAVKAGIPVITINSGQDKSAAFGALTHVGQDEETAGKGAGQKLKAAGVKKLLCVIHEAGNLGLEQRCKGAAEGLAAETVDLQVDIGDITAAAASIRARLQSDKSIDGVLTLNQELAVPAAQAAKSAGSSAKVATFDLADDVIQAIQAGTVLFAVDQQQYLQGYLPVQMLYLYATNLNTVGGGLPVLTGPGFVTKDNAAQVAVLAKQGTR